MMRHVVCAVCLVLLLGELSVLQAASTYNLAPIGSESSPGVSVNMSLTASGVLAGGLQISFKHEKGAITEGEWMLTIKRSGGSPGGTLKGTIKGGWVTFDEKGRVASLSADSLTITSGTGGYADVNSGRGTFGGNNDPSHGTHAPKSFRGILTLTF